MEPLPVYGITEFSEEKEHAFYANELGVHLKSHHFVNSPHKHSTYIAVLFTKGRGEHQIDFDTFPVKPGSVFLLNPGQVHCWKLSNDAEGYVFFHPQEFYNSIFASKKIEDYSFFFLQHNYPVIYLTSKDREKIKALFKEIYDEFSSDLPYRLNKLGTLVDLTYIELARLYSPKEGFTSIINANYLKVKKLQKFIDDNFKTKKFPKEYADLMNISPRHLSRLCQQALNKSTSDLISDRIIMEARRMLIHQDISVSEVADELGYEDYSYFTRLFKKKLGLSPKNFQFKSAKLLKD